jgi:hypothetical protein
MNKAIGDIKVNMNQNLWGLLISYVSLGISEYYKLTVLLCLSIILAIILTISVIITTIAYTLNYWKEKMK